MRLAYIRIEVLEVRPGLWCDTCALPSKALVTIAFGGGVSTLERCIECADGDR